MAAESGHVMTGTKTPAEIRFRPVNSEMEPIEVSAERVEVRGVVVGIVRLGL